VFERGKRRTAAEHALTEVKQQKASREEVRLAIEALDDDAFLKLRRVATHLIVGTSYRTPKDLLQDAFLSALELRRRWKTEYTFLSFLCLAMKGIASNDRESVQTQSECLASELGGVSEAGHDEVLANADVRTHVQNRMADKAEADSLASYRQRADDVFELFANDCDATMILMAMEDGFRGKEIQQQSELTPTEYETTRRRMNRRLDSTYPERGS
jgi:DNA-directed RNA polymerase specialized sigma24 family protein